MDNILRYPLNKAHFCQRQAEAREKNGQIALALEFREVAFQNLKYALTVTLNDIVQNSIKLQILHEEKQIAQLSSIVESQRQEVIVERDPKIDSEPDIASLNNSDRSILNSVRLMNINDDVTADFKDLPVTALDNSEDSGHIVDSSKSRCPKHENSDDLEQIEDTMPNDSVLSRPQRDLILKNSTFLKPHRVDTPVLPTLSFDEELTPLDCPPLNFLLNTHKHF